MEMGIGMRTRTVDVQLRIELADEIQLATAMVNTYIIFSNSLSFHIIGACVAKPSLDWTLASYFLGASEERSIRHRN